MSCAIPLFVLLLQRTTQETNFIFSDNCSWTFWRSWELIKQWKGKRLPLPDFTFLPFPLLHWMEPDSLLCPISLYFFTRVQVVLNGWNRSHSSALPDFTFLAFTLLHWMEPDSFLCTLALNRWNQSRSSAWFHLFMFTFLIIALSGIGLVPLPDFTFLFYLFHYCVEWNGSHSSAWFHFFTFFTTLLCWIYKCGQIHKTYLKCTNMIRKLKIILLPSWNSHLTQSKVSYGLCVDYLELGDC